MGPYLFHLLSGLFTSPSLMADLHCSLDSFLSPGVQIIKSTSFIGLASWDIGKQTVQKNLIVHGTVPPALFDCCPVANHNASSFHRMGWESSAAWTVQLPFSLVLGRVLLLWILKGRNVSLSFDGIIIPPLPRFVKHFSAFFVKTFYRFDSAERFPFSP